MKYRKEVQQHATFLPTSSIPCSTADIGIADEETVGLIRNHFSVASLSVNTWWGWWGLWYLKCNYSKQFGKLLSYDRHRFWLCSCLTHHIRKHTRPALMTLKFTNLCMAWLLRMNLYENSRCRGVRKHHLWWWESKRDCKCMKAFVHIPRLRGSSGDVC